jgi:hypothetical protein
MSIDFNFFYKVMIAMALYNRNGNADTWDYKD